MSILLLFKVWAYEAVGIFGDLLGGLSGVRPNVIPRILRWHCGEHHTNVHLSEFERKVAGNKVLKLCMLCCYL